jgi:hypothetical protein
VKLAAGAAVVLAVGAGLGIYFGLRGTSALEVPKAQQSAVLEQARTDGVIAGYRVHRFDQFGWDYRVVGADIRFATDTGRWYCAGEKIGAQCLSAGKRGRPLYLEYRPPAAASAMAILRIVETRMPKAHIKFFEVTTLG